MFNHIGLVCTGDSLAGIATDIGDKLVDGQYLGQTFIDLGSNDPHEDLTAAIRDFNLPTAVAPGNWPDGYRTADNDGVIHEQSHGRLDIDPAIAANVERALS